MFRDHQKCTEKMLTHCLLYCYLNSKLGIELGSKEISNTTNYYYLMNH